MPHHICHATMAHSGVLSTKKAGLYRRPSTFLQAKITLHAQLLLQQAFVLAFVPQKPFAVLLVL